MSIGRQLWAHLNASQQSSFNSAVLHLIAHPISTLGMVAKNFVFCRPPVKMNRTQKLKNKKTNMPRTVKIPCWLLVV